VLLMFVVLLMENSRFILCLSVLVNSSILYGQYLESVIVYSDKRLFNVLNKTICIYPEDSWCVEKVEQFAPQTGNFYFRKDTLFITKEEVSGKDICFEYSSCRKIYILKKDTLIYNRLDNYTEGTTFEDSSRLLCFTDTLYQVFPEVRLDYKKDLFPECYKTKYNRKKRKKRCTFWYEYLEHGCRKIY